MDKRRWLNSVLMSVVLALPTVVTAQSDDIDVSLLPDVIRVCFDENGFPPFTFVRPHNPAANVEPEGFNIALLNHMLAPLGKRAQYHRMPWRRCLAMAASGDMDVLLDVQNTPERQQILLIPTSHYDTRPAMIALSESRHVMQMITNKERMLSLDVCRMMGWDTSRLASAEELVPAGEPHNMASAITMLRQGRCDILIYTAELFSGGLYTRAINPDDFEGITFHLMPWQQDGIPKFFGVSRRSAAAQPIHDLLDSRIRRMRDSGELADMLADYLPTD